MAELNWQDFLNAPGTLLDVRSPSEYALGHVPGALSFPLFDDAERARIGTLYKQKGREEAVMEGLRCVGIRLAQMAERGRELAGSGPLRLYCWRGGMRSGSMAWLLRTAGLEVAVLRGGYKAYRQALSEAFDKLPYLVVLQGPTGSGKTDILRAMASLGEQVLDLEGMARHRGSAFGALGQEPQPQNQQFQNGLFEVLRSFDLNQPVWVEGESKAIGRCYLPDALWERMAHADVVEVELDRETRLQRIVREYGAFPAEALADSISRLRKRLGGLRMQQALEFVETGDLPSAAGLLLDYYDDAYALSRRHLAGRVRARLELFGDAPEEHARHLLKSLSRVWKPNSTPAAPAALPPQHSPS